MTMHLISSPLSVLTIFHFYFFFLHLNEHHNVITVGWCQHDYITTDKTYTVQGNEDRTLAG